MAESRSAINRRTFMGAMAGVGAAACAAPAVLTRSRALTGKPNIIIILSDDQGYQDLSSYGHPTLSTPNIDSIGEQGVRFTDFYSGYCICSPARACLMTGSWAPRVMPGMNGNFTSTKWLNTSEFSLPKLLKGQGYATFGAQKWHLGGCSQTDHGFDTWEGGSAGDVDRTKIAIDNTIAWINTHKSEPFFAYVALTCPHEPLKKGSYQADVEDMDTQVGRLLDYLDTNGLTDSTMVIFYSDNGPWQDACEQLNIDPEWCTWEYEGGSALPLRGEKFDAYEGGMRVPCVVRWPEAIPAGITCTEIATALDFYPTFANLLSAAVPCAMDIDGTRKDWVIDGKDISPLLTNETGATTPHEAIFYYDVAHIRRAVRAGNWKWHFSKYELYDLSTDIGETTNLYSERSDVLDAIRPLVNAHHVSIGNDTRPYGSSSSPSYTPVFDCVNNTRARYRPARPLAVPSAAAGRDLLGRRRPAGGSAAGVVVDPATRRSRVRAIR